MANSVRLSWGEGVFIDGIEFPYAVGEDIEVEHDHGVTVVTLRLLVDGTTVVVNRSGERKVFDRLLGDVGEWARSLVRAGFLDSLPRRSVPLTTTSADE